MARFNPLDPLGLFQQRDGTKADQIARTRYDVTERGIQSIEEMNSTFWPPPDPLGLFHRRSRRQPSNVVEGEYRELNNPALPPAGGKLSGAVIGNPIPIEWAPDVIPIKNQARDQLLAKGYSVSYVDKALHWGEEWLMGMARRLAPNNPDLQKSVVVSGYKDIAARAEKWLNGIEQFAAPAGSTR